MGGLRRPVKADVKARPKWQMGAKAVAPWDYGSPLYDSFQLASLYDLLDRNLMTLPYTDGPFRGEMRGREDGKEYKKVVILGGFVVEGMKRKIGVRGGIMKGKKFKKVKASFHGFYSSVALWKNSHGYVEI